MATTESILSAYIDMVEAEKAVALHDSVGQAAEGPATEVKMGDDRVQFKTRPWVLQAYTKGDLEACLGTWLRLVEAIEKRADPTGSKNNPEDDAEPLASRTALNVAGIPKGFAYDLLSHANYSRLVRGTRRALAQGRRIPQPAVPENPAAIPQRDRGHENALLVLARRRHGVCKGGQIPLAILDRRGCALDCTSMPSPTRRIPLRMRADLCCRSSLVLTDTQERRTSSPSSDHTVICTRLVLIHS